MQEEDKKQDKQQNMDKLRIILDNPYNASSLTKEDHILESVRKRLTTHYPTPSKHAPYKTTPDLLKPTVTIHAPVTTTYKPLSKPPEPTIQQPKTTETKTLLSIKTEDLYEIEKIETTQKTTDQYPEWIPVEEETKNTTPTEMQTQVAPSAPKEEIKTEHKPVETSIEETPTWEEVKEETTTETPVETQSTIDKKETETTKDIDQQTKINIFKDIRSIDEATAIKLYDHGVRSITQLKENKVKNLVKIGVDKKTAKKIIKEIKKKKEENTPPTTSIEPSNATLTETIPSAQEKTKEEPSTTTKMEWAPVQEKRKNKSSPRMIPSVEWETHLEEKKTTSGITQPYQHGEYTLYRKDIITPDGKKRTIHFFSKQKPSDAEPTSIPDGFEVKVNKKTGLPYLKKIT